MTDLTLIRHFRTAWNEEGRLQGRADVPLSDRGRCQAGAVRPTADMVEAVWVSSPLGRALETARLLGASPLIENRLIEADWGDWEGMALTDIRRSLGRDIPGIDYPNIEFCPPGGESGRSVQDRLKSWLVELAAIGKPTVAVTHKGIVQAALALAFPGAAVDRIPAIEAGSFHRFRVGPRGELSTERLDAELIGEQT